MIVQCILELFQARREEKKANQLAFKDEKKRQVKETINIQQAMSGINIQ